MNVRKYDAQLAVAEATKRQLERKKIALIVAECGSGKTKIGATALGALQGMHASFGGKHKTFNLIMAPSHVTKKWVREIGETLPNTFAMVVKSITDFDWLYSMYETGDKSVYEGRTYPIPVVSFFAASNEIPNFSDPQEKILEALYDRLELKVVTDNIADRDKRLTVLADKQAGRSGQTAASITLDELERMQQEVADIPVPDAANELADDILCQLRKDGIPVSDRKYLNYYPIAQARAWLSGHAQVESQDLLALKNYLWQKPGDRAVVEAALNRMCVNPMQDKVNNVRAMALDVQTEFEAAAADQSKPNAGSKALIKLRGELVRLYGEQQKLAASAQSDTEKVLTDGLLADMEQISRKAHEAVGFTYTPLEQLAALQ